MIGDLQSFVSNFMDEDTILDEIMDEEYYIFSGEGSYTKKNLNSFFIVLML